MKTDHGLKIMRALLVTAFFLLIPLLYVAAGCGSTTDTTPIPIPAPTGGYINGTAPGTDGKIIVYGYIYVAGAPLPNVTVTVTNTSIDSSINPGLKAGISPAISVTTTTDANGSFSTTIRASVGDNINIQYTDSATGRLSDATSTTVNNDTQPMSSTTMVPYDVDLDKDDSYAVIVANDGTNSEIIEINLATGAVVTRATFTAVTFDKVAVHSTLNHAAVLDTTNLMFYWYDLANLADDMTPTASATISTTPYDVAVVALDNNITNPYSAYDMIFVSHDINAAYGYLTAWAIYSNATLAAPNTDLSINHPSDDAAFPVACDAGSNPTCTGLSATNISLIQTAANQALLAIMAQFANGDKVTYFETPYINLAGPTVELELSLTSLATATSTAWDPYDLIWYQENTALMTDSTNGSLIALDKSGTNITASTLAVGTLPRGVYPDATNNRAFVADQTGNSVFNINMTNFTLSGTSYTANYAPTELVYDSNKIGVILTNPDAFRTIDITE